MRIISGLYKHRRFDVPNTFKARPTTDFAKENLFNVLSNTVDFEGITALDLFSGTGSIAFELISRGADRVVAIEERKEHARFIASVAEKLNCRDQLKLVVGDALRYISKRSFSEVFDLIFADPPYALEQLPSIPIKIFEAGLLKPDGVLVLEHPGNYSFREMPQFTAHRKYGSVNFSFFSPSVISD
ncbi:methyltransferase [Porphyromonas crevioricanis]|uniref:Methyltransferase n=1 Tax=Porphyromonas crevioricanis TaxID=393921 RepID=A0A0A2FCJ4_9PORP|nr:RsmD family RNA methyltransferase [Porphyromonas crevioricanis]KGN88718.1 methyltransferase [Porphyromonas crevioricanis]KGN93912.1 methyltransferase [Porphyromonas crevioricanis]SJZ89489.1 16S rRNA (guanine(966)-N(2))-methyltransferase RsmD [Porphyromonas crevioricanis]SQH73666.1 Ribosomal RNA small subunit methyltransferase D [Porphyromonas crevioricanis]